MRERIWLNNDWEFTDTCTEAFLRGGGAEQVSRVRLPHTVCETPYDYFDESMYQMVCAYRKVLAAPAGWRGRRVLLTFEAAGHGAELWINGEKVSAHGCGYTAFTTDLSAYLRYGEDNLISVRLDTREQQNIPPFGFVIDYMTYGGLYREAYLEVCEQDAFADLFVRTRVRQRDAAAVRRRLAKETVPGQIAAEFYLADEERDTAQLAVRLCVYSLEQRLITEKMVPWKDLEKGESHFPGGEKSAFCLRLQLPEVYLWDVESPALYRIRAELLRMHESREAELLDVREVVTGFRHAVFRGDGFWLNGRRLKLRGLNRHQSWPYAGYAMPDAMQRMDAEILKNELGLHAVRTSHYPQAQSFVDRCDELGLLVFTEIPGWQHIGDEAWKNQAVRNTEEMVFQYRNHPSVILWGVRINESQDDDAFYTRTNAAAHALDPSRQTGGVRYLKKSHLLEDVYTYNDFLHNGTNRGCERKKNVAGDSKVPYLITEYNGHMFPTKMFDSSARRQEHMLRHARVLDAVAGGEGISGCFGWCMADYNTHREFGSGDRICYHGVLDMFRNPKPAAAVYAAQQEDIPVLEVTSTMDIGEQPESRPGEIYVVSNADEVRVYQSGLYICTLQTGRPGTGAFRHLQHPPVLLDDFIGNRLCEEEGWSEEKAGPVRDILNYAAIYGFDRLPPKILARAAYLMAKHHMNPDDAYQLYGKYIGGWGDAAPVYRFDALKNGKVVKTVMRRPVQTIHLEAKADHTHLQEGRTYDVACIRLRMCDQDGNLLPFFNDSLLARTEGPVSLIGPSVISLRGGCGGTYVRTTGGPGEARLILQSEQAGEISIAFTIEAREKKGDLA